MYSFVSQSWCAFWQKNDMSILKRSWGFTKSWFIWHWQSSRRWVRKVFLVWENRKVNKQKRDGKNRPLMCYLCFCLTFFCVPYFGDCFLSETKHYNAVTLKNQKELMFQTVLQYVDSAGAYQISTRLIFFSIVCFRARSEFKFYFASNLIWPRRNCFSWE